MIIGICGLIGSGKGTVADILVEQHNYEKLSFADKLKDGVSSVFGWNREMLEGDTDESRKWREEADKFWTEETGETITPRLILQLFGTDCMRNGFFDGIWVSLVKQELLKNKQKNYVIPDVRFENEAKMIRSLGGKICQVRRGPDPLWFRLYKDLGEIPTDVHKSEWAWANVQMDYILSNDTTLDNLKNLVQDHLVST
tara:strand:- start:2449 stop:3042 length:594 start_codon:yes stop_codon:yes gene_type:complete